LCIAACPKGSIKFSGALNKTGYNAVTTVHEDLCTGCGMCFMMCPDNCIIVYKTAKEKKL
jgi:2-oxoglutarate ferredoxin oxidoreductase subunit delta